MWFGTKDGLCHRYDGNRSRLFMHDPRLTADGEQLIKNVIRITVTESGSAPIRGFISTIPRRSISPACRSTLPTGAVTKPISILDCDREGRVWIVVESSDVFLLRSANP